MFSLDSTIGIRVTGSVPLKVFFSRYSHLNCSFRLAVWNPPKTPRSTMCDPPEKQKSRRQGVSDLLVIIDLLAVVFFEGMRTMIRRGMSHVRDRYNKLSL